MAGAGRDGGYQRHCRDDHRPILGATPPERLERLQRLRAVLAVAGWDERRANRHAYATHGVIGIELLTAAEADALIATLVGK